LRSGITLAAVHQQLRGISSEKAIGFGPNKVLSMPDAIAQAIEQHLAEKQGVQQELLPGAPVAAAPVAAQPTASVFGAQPAAQIEAYDPGGAFLGTCPECAADLHYMEGCVKCMVCGYSECG
jgi:ribonucleoside-diphosphate reductase alpha chain